MWPKAPQKERQAGMDKVLWIRTDSPRHILWILGGFHAVRRNLHKSISGEGNLSPAKLLDVFTSIQVWASHLQSVCLDVEMLVLGYLKQPAKKDLPLSSNYAKSSKTRRALENQIENGISLAGFTHHWNIFFRTKSPGSLQKIALALPDLVVICLTRWSLRVYFDRITLYAFENKFC